MNTNIATVKVQGRADAADVIADVLRLTFGSVLPQPSDQDDVRVFFVDTAAAPTQQPAHLLKDRDFKVDVEVTGPKSTQDFTLREGHDEILTPEDSPVDNVVGALGQAFEGIVQDTSAEPHDYGQERYLAQVLVGRPRG